MTNQSAASKLARALRNYPCTCVTLGSWPRFKDVKAHPERECARCRVLREWEESKQCS